MDPIPTHEFVFEVSQIIIPQHPLIQPPVRDSPTPRPPGLATEQGFGRRRLLQHAVLLHRLDFVARRVREEVFEVFVFEGEGVAGDACLNHQILRGTTGRGVGMCVDLP